MAEIKYYLSKPCVHWDKERNARFKFHRYNNGKLEVFDKNKFQWVESANRNIPAKREMTIDEINSTVKGLL